MKPRSGGTAGGTTLTITGSGFGNSISDHNVLVGAVECAVMTVVPSEIVCKTGAHNGGTVDIVVSAHGVSATLSQMYTYDTALGAVITGFRPTTGAVYGGTLLTITGTGFPDVLSELTVTVGDNDCPLNSATATEITCTLPRNPPEQAKVVLDTQQNGRASHNGSEVSYSYVLTVTNVSPKRGSLNGGTDVTITGEGFHSNTSRNAVVLGETPCVVFESTASEIKCKTENGAKIVQIDNSGSHSGAST